MIRDTNETIKHLSYLDFYSRSRKSIVAFSCLYLLLIFSTSYFKDHMMLTLLVGAIIMVLSVIRLVSIQVVKKKYHDNPRFWIRLTWILTIATSLTWGLFCAATLHLYGFESKLSVFILIMTCGIMAGAVKAQEPVLLLMVSFVVLMILPASIFSLTQGEYMYTLLTIIYLVLILIIGKDSGQEYQAAHANNLLIKQQQDQVETTVNELTGSSAKLDTSSESLSSISGGMHTDSLEMAEKSRKATTSANTMNENIKTIASTSKQTTQNMGMIAGSMTKLVSAINKISSSTSTTLREMNQAMDKANQTSIKIDELRQTAKEIDSVTGIINDISDQTNLLALNATIEAARAGEAGKGFTVVANEIKELAKQTATATAQIKDQVVRIQTDIGERVRDITDVTGVMERLHNNMTALTQVVEAQTGTVTHISQNVEQMDAGISDIDLNISESVAATASIVADIDDVTRISETITQKSSEVNESSQDLLTMARTMNDLVQRLSSDRATTTH